MPPKNNLKRWRKNARKMIDVLSLHNEMQIIHKVAPAMLRQ